MWSPGAAPIDGRCTRRIARHLPRVRLGDSLARFATAREELPLGAPSCLIARRLCRDATRCSGASNLRSSWRSSSAAAQRAQGTLASSATRLVAHSMRPCVGVRGACEAERPEPTSSDALCVTKQISRSVRRAPHRGVSPRRGEHAAAAAAGAEHAIERG